MLEFVIFSKPTDSVYLHVVGLEFTSSGSKNLAISLLDSIEEREKRIHNSTKYLLFVN